MNNVLGTCYNICLLPTSLGMSHTEMEVTMTEVDTEPSIALRWDLTSPQAGAVITIEDLFEFDSLPSCSSCSTALFNIDWLKINVCSN